MEGGYVSTTAAPYTYNLTFAWGVGTPPILSWPVPVFPASAFPLYFRLYAGLTADTMALLIDGIDGTKTSLIMAFTPVAHSFLQLVTVAAYGGEVPSELFVVPEPV